MTHPHFKNSRSTRMLVVKSPGLIHFLGLNHGFSSCPAYLKCFFLQSWPTPWDTSALSIPSSLLVISWPSLALFPLARGKFDFDFFFSKDNVSSSVVSAASRPTFSGCRVVSPATLTGTMSNCWLTQNANHSQWSSILDLTVSQTAHQLGFWQHRRKMSLTGVRGQIGWTPWKGISNSNKRLLAPSTQ